MPDKTYDILHFLESAPASDNLGPRHKQGMKDIGGAATDLVEKTNLLVTEVTPLRRTVSSERSDE